MLEQNSLGSKDIAQSHFPTDMLGKEHLSKGAQRNFEHLQEVMQVLELTPMRDLQGEIDSRLKQEKIEQMFYSSKLEEAQLKVDSRLKPNFEEKLCLRDSLNRLYEG